MLGAIGVARDDGALPVPQDHKSLLTSLLDQVALAMERARLEREAREFNAVRERDRLRAALLSSIGQDLTPRLTAIGSAVRELKRSGSGDRQLVSAIGSEASKLDRYIANLLDLAPETNEQPIASGKVTIDLFNRVVMRDGEPVHLTPKEFAVFS